MHSTKAGVGCIFPEYRGNKVNRIGVNALLQVSIIFRLLILNFVDKRIIAALATIHKVLAF